MNKNIFEYMAITIVQFAFGLFVIALAILAICFVLSLPEILGCLIFG